MPVPPAVAPAFTARIRSPGFASRSVRLPCHTRCLSLTTARIRRLSNASMLCTATSSQPSSTSVRSPGLPHPALPDAHHPLPASNSYIQNHPYPPPVTSIQCLGPVTARIQLGSLCVIPAQPDTNSTDHPYPAPMPQYRPYLPSATTPTACRPYPTPAPHNHPYPPPVTSI